jgi:DNA-binding response OmpR family regulator
MATVRVLLGDTNPESRAALEPLCAEQGWELLVVESSFQILRMIRDTSEIALVMVNPALPGSGVSGKDVARTIKTSSQFSALPVLFVLHEGQAMPEGCAVNGAIEIDRSGPARLLAAMRETMGLAGDGDPAAPAAEPSLEPEPPRAVAADAGGAMAAVAPMPEHARPTRSARVVVADTDARTRGVLEPLFARQGWEMVGVESGFQVLRAVRDSEVDLVLINPSLQASGVSGADIARTIKSASQFRKLPVYFVIHEGQPPPKATVDGVIELGAWPPARILSTLNVAMGPPQDAVVTAPASAPARPPAPESLEGPPALAEVPEPPPMPPATAAAAPAELVAQLREEMFAEIRRAVASETRHAVERAPSAGGEGAGVSEETVERLVREEVANLAGSAALAEQLLPQIREEVRRATEGESREALEQAVRSIAQELLPELSAGMAAEAPPAVPVDQVVAQLREQLRQEIGGALEAATKQVKTDGRAAVEAAARQYLAGEGRSIAEPLIAAMAREMVPGLAERLLQHELARLPNPAAKIDELLPQIREQMGEEARRAAEAVARQHAEREARGAMESAARHYLSAEGHALAEPLLAALAREVVPPLAERLVRQQLDQLPSPGAKVDELLPPLREQMLQEARRAVEAIVRRYTETEGRSLVDQLIRQFAAGQGASSMEEILRAAARETVPKVAERLIQQELGRGPSATARIDELLAEMREQMREEARRSVEAVARRYAESDGRSVVDSVMRQFASTQGVSLAEELLRAAAREIVPAIAERLVQQELGRLPSPAAKLDELLPAVRDQILQEGRRAAEAVARRYAETDGRVIIESVIRQHTATHGTRFPEELVRGVARELVPAVAERLIREEIARLRREYRLD